MKSAIQERNYIRPLIQARLFAEESSCLKQLLLITKTLDPEIMSASLQMTGCNMSTSHLPPPSFSLITFSTNGRCCKKRFQI